MADELTCSLSELLTWCKQKNGSHVSEVMTKLCFGGVTRGVCDWLGGRDGAGETSGDSQRCQVCDMS